MKYSSPYLLNVKINDKKVFSTTRRFARIELYDAIKLGISQTKVFRDLKEFGGRIGVELGSNLN